MKICPVEAELSHAAARTDTTHREYSLLGRHAVSTRKHLPTFMKSVMPAIYQSPRRYLDLHPRHSRTLNLTLLQHLLQLQLQ
jgi:hypothetical protein